MVETVETKQGTEESETKPESDAKERIEELNTKLKAAEEKNELLQQNQALINANVPAAAPAAPAFDIYNHVGLEGPEDIPNVEQQKQINAFNQSVTDMKISQLRFVADHPDFSRIVGTAEQIRTGQFAAPLMKATKANPMLKQNIANSADPYAAAYAVAKIQADKDAKGDKTKTTKTDAEAAIEEAVKNANKVKSASNTTGGDGLSEEGRVANMSDADFMAAFNAHGGDL